MGDKIFTANFNKYTEMNEFFDFVFYVNGNAFKVHRVIFAARSAYFARLFHNHPNEYTFEDDSIDQQIFSEVVKFIYSDHVEVTDFNIMELLAVGKKFDLKGILHQVYLYQNVKSDPLLKKELETLKMNFDQAKYLYDKAIDRMSIKNPFNRMPARYY